MRDGLSGWCRRRDNEKAERYRVPVLSDDTDNGGKEEKANDFSELALFLFTVFFPFLIDMVFLVL